MASSNADALVNFASGTKNVFTSNPADQLKLDYDSGPQTITSTGQLVLAHNLGVQPTQITLWLVNTSAADGYSVDDEVLIYAGPVGADVANDAGTSVVVDATNITIRFGVRTAVFCFFWKTDGHLGCQTNT